MTNANVAYPCRSGPLRWRPLTEIIEGELPGIERRVDEVNDNPVRDVQRDFPYYRIWREVTGNRKPRHMAQARDPGVRPHTVMTADLAELRAELAAAPAPPVSVGRCGPGPPG